MIVKLLQLFDDALKYSKNEIIKEYDSYDDFDDEVNDLLLNKSIFPTGEKVGFYNYSAFSLEDIVKSNSFKEELIDYIDSFSDNINDVIYQFDIENIKKEDFMDLNYGINSKKDFDNYLESIISKSYNVFLGDLLSNFIDDDSTVCDLFTTDGAILSRINSNNLYAPNITQKIIDLRNLIQNTNLTFNKNLPDDSDLLIANLAFSDKEEEFLKIIKDYSSNLIITLSSDYFDENIEKLSNIKNRNNIKAIISLPIHYKDSNLILISIDINKTSNRLLLIDESDSVMHEDINNWSFISKELITNIISSYNEFKEYENAVIASIDSIIPNLKDKFVFDNNTDEPIKSRVISNEVVDEIFNSKSNVMQQITKSDIKAFESSNISYKTLFNNLIYGKKRQNMENLLYKNHEKLIDEVQFLTLGDIALLYEITDKNDKDTLLISTCKTCNYKLVHYNDDIDNFNKEIYIEINIISKDILKEYLYVYLNSKNGLDDIFYFSRGNEYIRAENIQHVRIPLPPINEQKEIINAVHESNEFFKSVELLKKEYQSNILDYKNIQESIKELRGDIEFSQDGASLTKLSRSWQHVYNGLIWPLAISYLSATKGGFETVEKLDKYLKLFEFVSAFNFIILLSGLPEDIYHEFKYDIWNAKHLRMYETMTFGTWIKLTENISQIYNKHDFTSKLDSNLFNKIANPKLIKTLNKAKDYRNSHAHGSFINSYEAQNIIDELNIYLEKIFDVLEVYSDYKLYYITGKLDNSGGNIKHQVIKLNGPCAQPIYEDIVFDEYLESNCLYLYNPKNNKKLLINKDFMKFSSTDDNNKHWALFIYYKCERVGYMKTNAHYKCFQSIEEDIIESISTFKDDIMK